MKHPHSPKSKLLTIFLVWIFLFLQTNVLFAQENTTVTGTVIDEKSEPLIGVIVKQKSTPNGTSTDIDGAFTLSNIPLKSILVFTYLGMQTQEIPYTGQKHITVTLKSTTNQIEEVVVVGYGTQRKSDLTGAVGSIDSKKIMERPVINAADALSGKIAGVQVSNNTGRPGGEINMIIRGANSISASNAPLMVIDGVIGADLGMLNPNDIESMTVLKDASSTAIYGSRAAAGVVVVTTKKGQFNTGTTVTYNMNLGISKLTNKLDVMNSREFMSVLNQGFANDGFEPVDWYKACPKLFNPDGSPIYDTDWQDEMTRTSFSNRHYLTLNTGSETSKTTVAFGYQNEQGIMLNSWLRRYNAKLSNDTKIGKKVQLSTALNYNSMKESRMDDYRIGADHTSRIMLECYPVIPVQYADGTYSKYNDFTHPKIQLDTNGQPILNAVGQKKLDYNNIEPFWRADNGVQVIDDTERYFYTDQVLGNAALNIDIISGLSFKTTIAAQYEQVRQDFYSGEDLIGFSPEGAIASRGVQNTLYWQNENFFTYDKRLKDHRVNATLGASWSGNTDTGVSASGIGFSSDFYKYYNLSIAQKPGIPMSHWTEWKMNSYFARANYTYKDKYMATVTGRYDGSSVFGADHKYAFFPSAALAWVMSEENFLKPVHAISNLKLRASIGQTGNSGIGAYSTWATMGNAVVTFADKAPHNGVIQWGMPNAGLKWETTSETNIGLDLGLLKNRISLGMEFYRKDTRNLLLSKPISLVNGYGSVMDNIGEVRNTGFEATLNTYNISTKDFNWSTTLLFSTNKNQVVKLTDDNSDIWTAGFVGVNYSLIRVGEPLYSIYGLKRAGTGTWGTDEAAEAAKYGKKPGDKKYVDKNGDNKIDYEHDGGIIGNLQPKFEMSLNNTFSYKNVDLSLDIQGKYGNKAANLSRMTSEQRTWYANSPTTVLNYWTPENQNTMIERPRTCMPFGGSPQEMQIDDNLIEDASYIRFKNLTFGYTFPEKIAHKLWLKKFRIYANLENFLLLTKYSGYDPEVQNMGGFSQGVEFFAYPKPMNFNFGFEVTF